MNDLNVQPQAQKSPDQPAAVKLERERKPVWETPRLEDVSEEVMAQPYIRFT
jgi:hypothetical protein